MRTASPARRAAGFLAVTTIGLSTAVLSVTGVASAAAPDFRFSSATTATSGVVPAGICAIDWTVIGGQGGAGSGIGESGEAAEENNMRAAAVAGQNYDLFPGAAGGNATALAGGTGGVGPQAGTVDDGAAGTEDVDPDGDPDTLGTSFGGGGGAGSVAVLQGGGGFVSARGGDGGGSIAGAASGETDSTLDFLSGGEEYAGPSDQTGPGLIVGTGVPCAAPPAPEVDTTSTTAGDGQVTVRFWAPYTVDDEGAPTTDDDGLAYQAPDGYEYSIDGGTTWATLTTAPGTGEDEARYGTVSGLENGTEVSILIRATSLVGPGATGEAVTATPYHMLSAPTDLRAAVGTSSIVISWSPPAGADADQVQGYSAWAIPTGAQSSADLVECAPMDATARTCLVGVPAGTTYSVGVFADNGHVGESAHLDTDVVVQPQAAPATVPTANGPLASSDADGALTAGQTVTLSGGGYLPNSSVDLYVYSVPVKIGTTVVDAAGNFTATVTLPAGLTNGTHDLVAAGVDADGKPRFLVVSITVSGGVATVTAAGLAYTGFSPAPFLGAGALALVAGGGLLVASRRRQA